MKCCFGVDAEGDDMGEGWYATETKSGIWRGALPFVMLGGNRLQHCFGRTKVARYFAGFLKRLETARKNEWGYAV
jgi:hypothetical protein